MRLATIGDLVQPEDSLRDLLDRATTLSQLYDDFVEADEGDGHLRAPGIHASEISKCQKRLVYSIMGTPGKRAIKKIWRQRFEIGKAIHAMIQRDFYKMAAKSQGLIHFEAEVQIAPKYQAIAKRLELHSSCDGVFTFRDDPLGPALLRIGLEIKSEAPDSYKDLKEPKPDHVEQAHVYMKALDLPLMYFMYFNKGNQNNTPSIHPYLITFNEALWQDIEARCIRGLEMAERKELPDRSEGIHCEFCPYAYLCQPNYLKKAATAGASRWKQLRS